MTIWSRLFGPYFFTAIIGILFLAAKAALTRSLDRWLAGGLAVLIVIWLFVMQIAPTVIWVRIATFLTG